MKCGAGITTRLGHIVHWDISPLYLHQSWSNLVKSSVLDYHKKWYILWGQVMREKEVVQSANFIEDTA